MNAETREVLEQEVRSLDGYAERLRKELAETDERQARTRAQYDSTVARANALRADLDQ